MNIRSKVHNVLSFAYRKIRTFCRVERGIHSIDAFLSQPYIKHANVSLLVVDARTGNTVFEHRSDKGTSPASNMKILTTATALEILGPTFCFPTYIESDGDINKNGQLTGNLYIRGFGDPTLGSSYFTKTSILNQWAQKLIDFGIKSIKGKIILDTSFFSNEELNPQWIVDDINSGSAQRMSAICYRDNSEPDFLCQFETDFIDSLKKVGINYSPVDLLINSQRRVLFVHNSPSLAELIKIINYDSNNFYAEQIFRYLGGQMVKPATIDNSIKTIRNYWHNKKISILTSIVSDGSGMAPQNSLNAKTLVEILQYMAHSGNFQTFLDSLPLSGESGTLADFMKNTQLSGRIYAKSGTTQRTKAYSGYIQTKDKSFMKYIFSIIINNPISDFFNGNPAFLPQYVQPEIEKFLLYTDQLDKNNK